jgi:hypothetical protein
VQIRDWHDLDAVRDNLGGNYILMNDLDSTTVGYEELASPTANGGGGWQPIGTEDDPFTGSLDGQGYEMRNLFIDGFLLLVPHVGVFGFIDEGGEIKDIGVVDAEVTGDEAAGGLVGVCNGTVTNSYSIASVTGNDRAGGLVGVCYGTVTNSYSAGSVIGDAGAGGLMGSNEGGTVSHCHSTCTVIGGWVVAGGLVGLNTGTVTDSYFSGDVRADDTSDGIGVGGLVGGNGLELGCGGPVSPGTVSNSYATGSVTGTCGIGGLVGWNSDDSIVSDSYATGNVTGEIDIGGLIGVCYGTVTNCYSGSNVNGSMYIGGLVGDRSGTIINSYYNYDDVLINGENVITRGALFGEDFDQWMANHKLLDVNEMFAQEGGYYVISDVNDLKHLLAFCHDDSLKFKLTDDLNLATEPGLYIPYFAGEFDGNGHKISNLSFNFDFISSIGLFGYLAPGGKATQVGVENVNITGDRYVGGLAGGNYGTVSESYSTGRVTSTLSVGGLVGRGRGTVSDSHSACSVTGKYGGGLVGENGGTVSNSYSTGNVTGDKSVGGLVGYGWTGGIVSNSFWDTETSGQATSAGGTGKNTTEMKDIATFTDTETEGLDEPWDITTVGGPGERNPACIWNIVDATTYPFLSWQP